LGEPFLPDEFVHDPAVSRRRVFRRAALAAGGTLAAATAVGAADRLLAQPSSEGDKKALNLLLLIDRAEVAFYTAALENADLSGELQEFAKTALGHEREHVSYLEGALGNAADEEPEYDFGNATEDVDAFARSAAKLEDVAVGAYNGQATNVTPGAFLAAARIVSVEARHAAWIRSIRDGDPAPDAVDTAYGEARVRRELRELGVPA
jgi:hypothetical protein